MLSKFSDAILCTRTLLKKNMFEGATTGTSCRICCLFANLVEGWLLDHTAINSSTVEMSKSYEMILSQVAPWTRNTWGPKAWSILHQRDLRLVTLCGIARLARHRHGLVARCHRIERFWLPLHGHSARQKSWRLGQGRYEKYWENAPSWLCPE